MTDTTLDRAPASRRRDAALDLAVVLAVMALMFALPAVNGGPLAYLLVPLKMLVMVLVATVLLRRRGESWRGLGWARPASLWRAALLVPAGYLVLAGLIAGLMYLVFPVFGIPPTSSAAAFAFLEGDPWKYASWLAVAWTSAAIGEELLFRGFLQSRLEILFGGTAGAGLLALVVQAAVFGFGHGYQGAGGVLLTGAAGLVLGVLRLVGRGNLAAGMVLHGLIDTISLTAVFLGALKLAGGA